MKKVLPVILAIILVFALMIPAFAVETHVQDNDNVFTSSEVKSLEKRCTKISEENDYTVYIITIPSLDGKTIEECSEEYFKENNLDDNCIYVIFTLKERKLCVTAHGEAEKTFPTRKREVIFEFVQDDMASNEYYDAMVTFLDEVVDVTHVSVPTYYIFVALGIGFLISIIICLALKKQLKSVAFNRAAEEYVKEGTLQITESRDVYLYSTTSKTKKAKDDDNRSSSSSGGGFGHTSGGF